MRDSLYLYHVTYKSNLPSIREKGILINPPSRNWDGIHAPLLGRIYICRHPSIAGGDLGNNEITVALLLEDLDIHYIVMDEDTIYPYWEISWGEVKKEGIRSGEDKRKWLLRVIDDMGLCGGIASLVLNGTCAYKKDIPATMIRATKNTTKYKYNDVYFHDNIPLCLSTVIDDRYSFSKRGTIQFPNELIEAVLDILSHSETPIADLTQLENERILSMVA